MTNMMAIVPELSVQDREDLCQLLRLWSKNNGCGWRPNVDLSTLVLSDMEQILTLLNKQMGFIKRRGTSVAHKNAPVSYWAELEKKIKDADRRRSQKPTDGESDSQPMGLS